MTEAIYQKDSDYEISSLRVDTQIKHRCSYQPMTAESKLRRTFNFLSGQVTTVITESVYQNSYHSTGYAPGHSSTAVQSYKESFSDLPCPDEIEFMHAKLKSLGGKPPALDGVLSKTIPGRKNSFGK